MTHTRPRDVTTHAAPSADRRAGWDELGDIDAKWAIFSRAGKLGNRWDDTEFFSTGEREVAEVSERLEKLLRLPPGPVLDFGCGIGRNTLALAPRFGHVVGVDIASSMIERARTFANGADVEYEVLDATGSLERFSNDTFALCFSVVTLQHIEIPKIRRLIREFVRVTKPGGCIYFQLPSNAPKSVAARMRFTVAPLLPTRLLAAYVNRRHGRAPRPMSRAALISVLSMNGLEPVEVIRTLTECGSSVVGLFDSHHGGRHWGGHVYVAVKR